MLNTLGVVKQTTRRKDFSLSVRQVEGKRDFCTRFGGESDVTATRNGIEKTVDFYTVTEGKGVIVRLVFKFKRQNAEVVS